MENSIAIVEMIVELESHDDFGFDYDGPLMKLMEGRWFPDRDKAWSYVKSLFSSKVVGMNCGGHEKRRYHYTGERLCPNGDVYRIGETWETDNENVLDDARMEAHVNTGDEECVLKVVELTDKGGENE